MSEKQKRLLQAIVVIAAAGGMLATFMAILGHARTSAPLRGPSDGHDLAIQAITVTGSANLPISDTRPHQAVSKTVYFNNSSVSGTAAAEITLEFWISDTSPLTLAAGPAFGDPPPEIFTDSSATGPWRPVVSYSVEAEGGSWPSVPYTITDSGGEPWTVRITYTRDVTAPTVPTPTYPTEGSVVDAETVTFTWEASADDQSGVLSYTVVVTGVDQVNMYPVPRLTSTQLSLGSNGVYTWQVQALDAVENSSGLSNRITFTLDARPLPLVYLPLMARNYPPRPTGTVTIARGVSCVYKPSVTLDLSASLGALADTVSEMRLRNKGADWPVQWESYARTKAGWPLSGEASALRTVEAQFRGSKGGVSEPAADSIYLMWNGDFQNEHEWSGWQTGRGGFSGHGRGLEYDLVPLDANKRARMGNPDDDDQNGHIPVGYAYIAHELAVPAGSPRLSLGYGIHSLDTVWGHKTGRYWDTFEVSINTPPELITDRMRTDQGCHDLNRLNPTGTLTPMGDGLVFCGGHLTTDPGAPWDSGPLEVTVDLRRLAGRTITLYIATWSREYDSDWWNNEAYYNTYSYVDYVWMEGDW